MPEEVDKRLGEIETALAAFEERPVVYEPDDVARAGAFVSIDSAGVLRVERGYVRPEDELPVAAADGSREDDGADPGMMTSSGDGADADNDSAREEPDDDDGVRLLSDRLMTELTAHRTVALREAVANDPDVALLAVLHVLCLKLFYRCGLDSCLEIEPKRLMFGHVPGLADTAAAKAIDARHDTWAAQLPKEPGELWDVLAGFDSDSRQGIVCPLRGPYHQRRGPGLRPAAEGPRARRTSRRSRQARHGGGRLTADGRKLSRPRQQGTHPRCGPRGQGRRSGGAPRPPQESRDGKSGRRAARRDRLGTRALADARADVLAV